MKFNKIKILAVLPFLIVFISCDNLDMMPSDSIEPSKAFRNLDDINMGVLGAYAALDYDLITTSAIISDEIRVPGENVVSNTDAHRWLYNSGSGSVTSAFFMYYRVIDRVNRVLENIDLIDISTSQADLKQQYRGELLALRAYAHFELLRAYAAGYEINDLGVPYMVESKISYPPRDTFGSNVDDINADLSEAKNLIPSSFQNNTRITKLGVAAIQARLALYSKDWEDAVAFSSEVISAKPLASINEFPAIWEDESNTEVIWKLERVTGDSNIGNSFFRQSGEIVLYAPSNKLLALFDMENDIRFESYILHDPTRNELDDSRTNFLVKKYIGNDPANPGLVDIKLFRTGEMYLIRAEAYAELGNLTGAANDLNTLREHRIEGYSAESFSGAEQIIAEIFDERYIELAFEGHRFFDLKRRDLAIVRLPEDVVSNVEPLRLEPNAAQYNLPIPSSEIAVNKNIVQNPNY